MWTITSINADARCDQTLSVHFPKVNCFRSLGTCISDTRLHDFQIGYLYDWPTGSLDPSSYPLCATYSGAVGSGATESVNCNANNSGRFIVVQIPGSNERLTLCEVKVFVSV